MSELLQDVLKPFIVAFCIGITAGLACIGTNIGLHWMGVWVRKKATAWWCVRRVRVKKQVFLSTLDDDDETQTSRLDKLRHDQCAVCLCDLAESDGETTDLLELPCGHIFHDGCLRGWLERVGKRPKMLCPMCRRPALVSESVQLCLRPQCRKHVSNTMRVTRKPSAASSSPSVVQEQPFLADVMTRSGEATLSLGEMLRSMRSRPVGSFTGADAAPDLCFNNALVPNLPGEVYDVSLEAVDLSSSGGNTEPSSPNPRG